ncbi:MAG: hypothetical protein D6772_07650 [Bacteroidetes bacterium]|nr:MAG: hypothetical protein D6772_07650 [Bacteroidota bacterium]
MVNRLLGFLTLLSLLGFSACQDTDQPTGDLALNFTATYADAPLVLLAETYTYPSGVPLRAQLVHYFISDLSLLKSSTSDEGAQLLSEIELVAHDNTYDEESARAGVTFSFTDLPAGNYSAIRLGLGVAPRLNASQPGDYTAGHPLSQNYWSPATDYIFAKVEGTADLDADGEFETGLTYHMGADELYTELVFPVSVRIQEGRPARVEFTLDLSQVFTAADGSYLDISDPNLTIDHTIKPEVYEFLWTNMQRALRVR